VVKIRQVKQVINKAIYLALGVNVEGHKELLGMWLLEKEGANYPDTGRALEAVKVMITINRRGRYIMFLCPLAH
jgi:transposase-like protein